jgi:hypothetical protein
MRALFEARLEDLRPGDLVKIECICGHSELLTAIMLASAGVKPSQTVLDLGLKLRCRECDMREGDHLDQVGGIKTPPGSE